MCCIQCRFRFSYLSIPQTLAHDRCNISQSFTFFFNFNVALYHHLYNCFQGGVKTGQGSGMEYRVIITCLKIIFFKSQARYSVTFFLTCSYCLRFFIIIICVIIIFIIINIIIKDIVMIIIFCKRNLHNDLKIYDSCKCYLLPESLTILHSFRFC